MPAPLPPSPGSSRRPALLLLPLLLLTILLQDMIHCCPAPFNMCDPVTNKCIKKGHPEFGRSVAAPPLPLLLPRCRCCRRRCFC